MKKNAVNRLLTRVMFNRADLVIVLSDDWKSKVEAVACKAAVVKLFNPAPRAEWIDDGVVGNTLNILFLGRLSIRKGTYDLLECIKDQKAFYLEKDVKFIVAGDGDVNEVRSFVDSNGLNRLINVPGWVSGERKKRYLSNADIYILPSYHEQMPMSILEAMAYGVPVISTSVAGIPELIEDGMNGILIDPGDREHLKNALQELIASREKRISMGRENLKRVAETFDGRIIIRELVSIYNRL